jgi:putative membrane protein
MKTYFLQLGAVLTLLAGLGACSGNSDAVENAQKVNEARNEDLLPEAAEKKADYDAEFMAKAASGGMLEIELGKLVLARGSLADAKTFARHMVDDHSKVNAELMALAHRKHIVLPTMMGDDHQDVYKDIEEKKGPSFDREYLHEMRQDHEEDVKEFTEAAAKASDPDIRDFAARTLPRLQEHLSMVMQMEAKLRPGK